MLSITKKFEFDAAHHLPYHEGACNRCHGHRYVLECEIKGEIINSLGPELGMIMDFGNLKRIVNKEIISKVDHTDLNGMFLNPTAERMTESIACILCPLIDTEERQLIRIRLWETPDSYAEWRRNDG